MSKQQADGKTVVVDPNPMNEILKRAEQLRSETTDGVIYPCEYCQKVFKFKYEYERHAKIHSGDRPWQCPDCMKTFSRKDNMRAHMKIHTGELVRHVCKLCGKSYGRKYDLQVHERVHTGERPFECGSCGKSFISTSRLRAHQLIHCKNIYLPRHVRNKKPQGDAKAEIDSPTDSLDGSPAPSTEEASEEAPASIQRTSFSINPVRNITISLIESPAKLRPQRRSDDEEEEDDDEENSPDSGVFIDIEEKMLQLEQALMQRKAELEERGIKVEVDAMLGMNSKLRHEDFHVVLPTEACKEEPAQG